MGDLLKLGIRLVINKPLQYFAYRGILVLTSKNSFVFFVTVGFV